MSYEFLQPWSTFVMKTQLPPPILEKMIRITDEIIENRTGSGDDIGAGQIEDQFWIELEILEEAREYFLGMCNVYVMRQQCQSFPDKKEQFEKEEWFSQMLSMWTNSQKDNEYLPIHVHRNCAVSAVMYLKIPEFLPSRNSHIDSLRSVGTFKSAEDDGVISFTSNCTKDIIWGSSTLHIQPQVGDFYIFSASQQHQVYPFKTSDGKGERRSVSLNGIFTIKGKEGKEDTI